MAESTLDDEELLAEVQSMKRLSHKALMPWQPSGQSSEHGSSVRRRMPMPQPLAHCDHSVNVRLQVKSQAGMRDCVSVLGSGISSQQSIPEHSTQRMRNALPHELVHAAHCDQSQVQAGEGAEQSSMRDSVSLDGSGIAGQQPPPLHSIQRMRNALPQVPVHAAHCAQFHVQLVLATAAPQLTMRDSVSLDTSGIAPQQSPPAHSTHRMRKALSHELVQAAHSDQSHVQLVSQVVCGKEKGRRMRRE